MIGQKIEVERLERLAPDQPLGDRPAHPVMQALADHTERQGVQFLGRRPSGQNCRRIS